MTTLNIAGKFKMNKALSESMDEMLNLQGVGWLKRKAMSTITITITIKHYENSNGVESLSLVQSIPGVDAEEPEEKVLNWVEQIKDTKMFGPCVTKARRVRIEELEDTYLKDGWDAETLEHGCILVHLAPQGKAGWSMIQTWGMETINGEKHHVRRISLTAKGETLQNRIVYDYVAKD
ncbi:hypothetical protein GYMLUDRAFT_32907 [Collybiopsis luxurians FD-317 M1]|nr:hypothetical protein GYMLUDRAFT_32907 [Collybiopsis luxurians FD-317 M1]